MKPRIKTLKPGTRISQLSIFLDEACEPPFEKLTNASSCYYISRDLVGGDEAFVSRSFYMWSRERYHLYNKDRVFIVIFTLCFIHRHVVSTSEVTSPTLRHWKRPC